jgi:hypothetical protein
VADHVGRIYQDQSVTLRLPRDQDKVGERKPTTHDFLKIELVVSAARSARSTKERRWAMHALAIFIESDLLHKLDRHGEIDGANTEPERYEVHFERESAATESPYTDRAFRIVWTRSPILKGFRIKLTTSGASIALVIRSWL